MAALDKALRTTLFAPYEFYHKNAKGGHRARQYMHFSTVDHCWVGFHAWPTIRTARWAQFYFGADSHILANCQDRW